MQEDDDFGFTVLEEKIIDDEDFADICIEDKPSLKDRLNLLKTKKLSLDSTPGALDELEDTNSDQDSPSLVFEPEPIINKEKPNKQEEIIIKEETKIVNKPIEETVTEEICSNISVDKNIEQKILLESKNEIVDETTNNDDDDLFEDDNWFVMEEEMIQKHIVQQKKPFGNLLENLRNKEAKKIEQPVVEITYHCTYPNCNWEMSKDSPKCYK